MLFDNYKLKETYNNKKALVDNQVYQSFYSNTYSSKIVKDIIDNKLLINERVKHYIFYNYFKFNIYNKEFDYLYENVGLDDIVVIYNIMILAISDMTTEYRIKHTCYFDKILASDLDDNVKNIVDIPYNDYISDIIDDTVSGIVETISSFVYNYEDIVIRDVNEFLDNVIYVIKSINDNKNFSLFWFFVIQDVIIDLNSKYDSDLRFDKYYT